ncbi:two-component sensor histidine kinase [Thiosulfatimonas sediminis]|uniref:histidine kinase n=1 Tax=Thiosulfatimonas sediminis TaxID=2675054 RepID=A0A6F8PSR8_9GAMM|nr:HAMP domain-containing sensor histidine kinase [Thiosulfatimonas sediminis]BBP45171.1 two-component sensor histidine kinase [Thiosulfatimonas sediminis]
MAQKSSKLLTQLFLINGSLMALFIILFIVLVAFAEQELEQISLQHWIQAEAQQYEQDYLNYGIADSYPNRYQFDIYWQGLANRPQAPQWLQAFTVPGFYEVYVGTEDKHLLVRPDPSGQGVYYLVYKEGADDYLDTFEYKLHLFVALLGVVVLLMMLLYVHLTLSKVARPLKAVLQKIKQMAPDAPDFNVDAQYQELRQIEDALLNSKRQIADFFRRERDFSRFSAHEIRTPLMVLKGSAQILERLGQNDQRSLNAQRRIEKSCDEIALLTETFLLLGKQSIEAEAFSDCHVNPIVQTQIQVIRELFPGEILAYDLQEKESLRVAAPESFFLVLVRNLLKNAFSYSSGTVRIRIDQQGICVVNPCQADSAKLLRENRSYGYGLEIVERICQSLDWQFFYQQRPDEFYAEVVFQPLKIEADNQIAGGTH